MDHDTMVQFADDGGFNWGGRVVFMRFQDGYRVYSVDVYVD